MGKYAKRYQIPAKYKVEGYSWGPFPSIKTIPYSWCDEPLRATHRTHDIIDTNKTATKMKVNMNVERCLHIPSYLTVSQLIGGVLYGLQFLIIDFWEHAQKRPANQNGLVKKTPTTSGS